MKVLLLIAVVACLATSCAPALPPVAVPTQTPVAVPTRTATPVPLSSDSIYQLPGVWQDQDGKTIPLSDLSGKVQLLAMVYSSCKGACPRLVQDMRAIEARLGKSDVGFVLVTFDPEVDTPEKLRQMAAREHVTPGRWRLLRGDSEQVRDLAAALGVQYSKSNATDYVHSNIITVLGPKGDIIHQQSGLGRDPEATLKIIKAPPCCP